VLTGSNTYGGTTTISAGTLQIGPGGALGPNTVTNNSVLQVNRPDSFTLGNSVSGSGALVQTGTGTLIVTGNNSYSGGTRVNAGNVAFSSANSIPGSGKITISGPGAVNVSGAFSTVSGWLNSNEISTASNGALALALVGTSNESINIGNYSQLSLGAASPGTTYSGVLTPAGSTYYLGGGGGTLTFTPNLTGARSLVVDNPGTVVLSGSNTYSGGTTVTNGTLKIVNPSSLPVGSLNVGSNLGAFGLGASPLVLSGTSSTLGSDLNSLPVLTNDTAGVDPSSGLLAANSLSRNPAAVASADANAVPEPGALALAACGFTLVCGFAGRARSQRAVSVERGRSA
jgi:fibronectin-binding autotransporter adhesin